MAGPHGLLSELQHLQRFVSCGGAGLSAAAVPDASLFLHPTRSASTDEEDDSEAVALQAARAAGQEQLARLQREVAGLQQRLRQCQEERDRLQQGAARERQEAALATERLQVALLQQRAECKELSDLVLSLRDENDALQAQLQGTAAQAQKNEQETSRSVHQLSAAARQWRQQHEEVMRQLLSEQEQGAALRSELRLVREQLQAAEASLEAERRGHQQAAARSAGLEAAFGEHGKQAAASEALVAELRRRLQTERTWRKATQAWLRAELHTKDELERLLLSVGTSCRLGQPQPVPPRLAVAAPTAAATTQAQQTQEQGPAGRGFSPAAQAQQPAASPGAPYPPATSPQKQGAERLGSLSQASPQPQRQQSMPPPPPAEAAAPCDWRSAFETTIQAFEARYERLQQELAAVKQQAAAAQQAG